MDRNHQILLIVITASLLLLVGATGLLVNDPQLLHPRTAIVDGPL